MSTAYSEMQHLVLQCAAVSRAIEAIPAAIAHDIGDSVQLLLSARQILTVGVGKSGFVAMKFAATLMSLRYPARFMNAVDLHHGDAGVVSSHDVAVLVSKSGETPEVLHAHKTLRAIGVRTISITMNATSRLATLSDVALVVPNVAELDDHGLLPTTSVVVAHVVCDLLCIELLRASDSSSMEQLRSSHPHGSIGAILGKQVKDIMHTGEQAPFVAADASVGDALVMLSTTALGVVCTVDEYGALRGILTDGDVRRLASNGQLHLEDTVQSVMTTNPVVVDVDASVHDALRLMEHRDRQLSALPVMKGALCIGVVRLHDIARLQV